MLKKSAILAHNFLLGVACQQLEWLAAVDDRVIGERTVAENESYTTVDVADVILRIWSSLHANLKLRSKRLHFEVGHADTKERGNGWEVDIPE
jgi:hypothetical protein